jgi:hypothetical protein
MLELLKIKKDINWLVDQIKCLIRKSDLDSPLSAIEWSTNHSVALGNPYILDCFVWFEGHVYKSLINDNQYPPTNSNYWADLGTGHLLVEESSASGSTNLSPTQTATNFTINSDTGTDATIPLGNGTSAGATLNNYTTSEKNKLAGIATGAEVNVNADWNSVSGDSQILNKPIIPSVSGLATVTYVDTQDALKVDKVSGKGLSTEDYTTTEKNKLTGIAIGAEVNVNADWNATSGDAQILNKPTISGTNTGDQDLSELVVKNTPITGATKTKITYDEKGLVTIGTDATTADIADSTNRRYVTDAKLVVLNNTTNNNSGDNAVNSLYSGLASSKQNTLSGTGFVKSTAGVISYDTSTYLTSAVTSFSGGTTGLTPSTATSGIITLAGTLAIANGGTGAVTAAGARTNLGATTIGSNIFTVTNPGAITFLRANANNTVSLLSAADFRTAIGVGTGGTITLNPIGSAPNVNGATITGSVLNLQPASLNFGGVVTIDPQTFAGIKSFTEDLVVNALTVGKGGAVGNTAVNNTAIGVNALKLNTANNNTAIGKSALANNVAGYQNTAIGVEALLNNVGGPSSENPTIPYVGIYNTAVGFESLKSNTGNNNTAVGIGTLAANTIGFQNTAIGSEALKTNTSGEENTAVGKDALRQNIDSNWNTAVGSSALQGNVGGFQNTAVGRYASYSNFGGAYNTSIGVDSLAANINSNLNTGLGYKAGYTVTGARNTFLGSQDDNTISPQVTTVINSIAIGNNAYTTKSNQAVLGNSLITETVLHGNIKLVTSPSTSLGSYNFLTVNTVGGPNTGNIESIPLVISGTNTGDNATNTQYSGLAISKQDTLQSTVNIKSINGNSLLGSGDLTISATAAAQSAYTILTNNTNASAVPTEQVYKEVAEQSLSGTGIIAAGGTLPTGTNTHFYRWSQVGNLVTVRINLNFGTAGTCSGIAIPFANMPDIPQIPQHSSLYATALDVITFGSGTLAGSKVIGTFAVGNGTSAIRIKTLGAPNTYEFVIGRASGTYNNAWAQIQYYI